MRSGLRVNSCFQPTAIVDLWHDHYLASELNQKLTQLAPSQARALERMVREAMALADANDAARATNPEEAGFRRR